jgi:hypothetical protein
MNCRATGQRKGFLMGIRLSRRSVLELVVLSIVIAGAVAIVASSSAGGSRSHSIEGRMVDISNFPCASATGVCSSFRAKGDLKGNGVVFVDSFPAQTATPPNGIAVSNAHTVLTTKKGELHCVEAALFDLNPGDHAFVDVCLITGGTGIYDGATGYIQEAGTFDFEANVGELEYTGKLVLADD